MTAQANESGKKKGLLGGLLGGGKAIWLLALGMALVAMVGALTILNNAAATQVYYVLARDVPARTQITADMLVPLEAKVGQAPATAFDSVYVSQNEVFSQIALQQGDVVTASNAGPLTRITENVPDNFVAASFTADPDLAVAGKVRAGDYIDLISTFDGDAGAMAKVVMQHVLVLDVTVSPNTISSSATDGQEGEEAGSPGPESEAVRSGIPSTYTVALTPEDATKLALIRQTDLYVVLSGNLPDTDVEAVSQMGNLFSTPAGDSSAGTFGSIFIKKWDNAFEPGNVYVDDSGNVWKVVEGVWTEVKTGTALEQGDTPPGFLPVPAGTEFVDAEGIYWVAVADSKKQPAVWTAPENDTVLEEGDFPTGYNPRWEFPETADADAAAAN